ncbi:Rz1-like lysis system protein LysC [Paraferrimonas sedimenticola]|uniref:Rz1-like lysis system protein LysC n=1 Tax=Paraferrimonas sedimenticola TaxID=375674 RepID=UPI003CCC0B09
MNKLNAGLIVLCLTILSGCCSTEPITRTVTVTKVQLEPPPESLIPSCPIPRFTGNTNAELTEYTLALLKTLKQCQSDIQQLRDWRSGVTQP